MWCSKPSFSLNARVKCVKVSPSEGIKGLDDCNSREQTREWYENLVRGLIAPSHRALELGIDTGKARTFAQTHRHKRGVSPSKSTALKKFSRNLPLLRETRPVQKPRADECERKRNRIIQNNGKTTEEKSTRMRRVPFFYLACCLQTNLWRRKREEVWNWTNGKNPKLVKKRSTQPKAEKEKERKERPSASYRCHVSSNSFKVNNSILNPCAEALFAFITRDKKMTKIREQGRCKTKLSPSRSRQRKATLPPPQPVVRNYHQ